MQMYMNMYINVYIYIYIYMYACVNIYVFVDTQRVFLPIFWHAFKEKPATTAFLAAVCDVDAASCAHVTHAFTRVCSLFFVNTYIFVYISELCHRSPMRSPEYIY